MAKEPIYVGENGILWEHFRTTTTMSVENPKKTYQSIGYSVDNGWIRPSKIEVVDGVPVDVNKERVLAQFLKENPMFVHPPVEEVVDEVHEMESIPDSTEEE